MKPLEINSLSYQPVFTKLEKKNSKTENKQNPEIPQTSNVAEQLTSINLQKKNKFPSESKLKFKTFQTSEVAEKLILINLQNKNKFATNRKHNTETRNTSCITKKSVLTNLQNENKSYIENKSEIQILKEFDKWEIKKEQNQEFRKLNVVKLASRNMHQNYHYSKTENKPNAKPNELKRRFRKLVFKKCTEENSNLNALINDILELFVLPGRLPKKKCDVPENKSKAKIVKRSKVDKRKAGKKRRKKNRRNIRNIRIKENTKELNKPIQHKLVCNDTNKENRFNSQMNESKYISESKIVRFSTRKIRKVKAAFYGRRRNKNSVPIYISTGKIVTQDQDNLLKRNFKSNKNSAFPNQSKDKVWTIKEIPVKLTKKSAKRYAGKKIKLIGKFAKMDLEKKNKDERYKMMAKQASFDRYANFYYDD